MAEQTRQPWDTGRLFQTLTYFEVIPFWGCLQRLFSRQPQPKPAEPSTSMDIILVTGATGGVGKRVVNKLLSKKDKVRVLVRDAARARELFGDKVEIFEGDLAIAETLTPKLMENVVAVINCTGTKVQPIEGDTPTREKYYQGIKFYMPEVVDVPEIVEYEGIKNLVTVARKYLKTEKTIFDFTQPTQDIKEIWGAVDDVVMGGISSSQIQITQNRAIFSGNVSTANNGGFASVRTKNFAQPLDLSQYDGIELKIQGDGKRYKLIVRGEDKWDGVGYCYSFDTWNNQSQNIRIPFDQLIPVFRAKTVPEKGKFNPRQVYSLQLMHSKFEYDGELNRTFSPGLFSLEIESINAYGNPPTPQWIHISSAGVTRPGRPGLNLEEEPPAVRLNEQLGGILTWKLRGEDVIRQSGLNYTIVRPCALTEDPEIKALIFEQGDNIRGQVSRAAIAELSVQLLETPEACNKTVEVKEMNEPTNEPAWANLLGNLTAD
ncbi:MAG: CIA30 family protein [Snowella sp.]|nr:CIA30 family protein [Snowella sp.]